MEQTAGWLGSAVRSGIPVLGICFGHQLLAHALGGTVSDNPNGVEVGTVMTRCEESAPSDPLFSGLPSQFPVQASHRQAVVRLPAGAVRLARSELDPHHAFRAGKCAWGVQFHPEFDSRTVNAYIRYYARQNRSTAGRRSGRPSRTSRHYLRVPRPGSTQPVFLAPPIA